mgnify:CR=1 FL=1
MLSCRTCNERAIVQLTHVGLLRLLEGVWVLELTRVPEGCSLPPNTVWSVPVHFLIQKYCEDIVFFANQKLGVETRSNESNRYAN